MKATQDDPADRFWALVDRRSDDECWVWKGPLDSRKRYGQFRLNRRRETPWRAHRYALFLTTGERLTSEQVVRHICDNPPCCNPAHLAVGTQADNIRDMFAKGRNRTTPQRGEANYAAKLSDEKVRDIRIRAAAGVMKRTLAREYGVSDRLIALVVRREAWKHVA